MDPGEGFLDVSEEKKIIINILLSFCRGKKRSQFFMSEEKIKKAEKSFFLVRPDFITSEGSLTKEYTECSNSSIQK